MIKNAKISFRTSSEIKELAEKKAKANGKKLSHWLETILKRHLKIKD